MSAEPPVQDDPVIRRIAAARPPVEEEDLSPTGPRAVAILERVLATPGESIPRRARRPRWTLPRVGLALAPVAAVAAAAVVLILLGTFGPDDSGTQTANAAILKATVRALTARAGSIYVYDMTNVSGPLTDHGRPYSTHEVFETPSGAGPQNALSTSTYPGGLQPGHRPLLDASSYVGGEEAVFSPTTNTIYESSIWGPYLHRGHRPGTYVYRHAQGAPLIEPRPITVSQAQRRGLLSGDLVISPTASQTDRVQVPQRVPSPVAYLRDLLREHGTRVDRHVTVEGRSAIRFTGPWGPGLSTAYIDVDPRTHLPFEQVSRPGTSRQSITRMYERMLPITTSTRRMLSLHALHPTARIDRSHADYLRVAGNITIYPG